MSIAAQGDPGPPLDPGEGDQTPSTPAQQAPLSSLYSERLKVNVVRSERLKRKVLEVSLESDERARINLDKDTIAKLIAKLGIDIKSQLEGYQTGSRKLFLWCKDSVQIERFCSEESIKVSDSVKTGLIKPMDRREVEVKISGLNLNTPDSLIVEYISKHGTVVNNKVIYDTDRDGPLKGFKNGDRRYLVDFTNGRNMGSFHILDGANVFVNYSGQKKTCGRCHNVGQLCPGGAIARTCELRNGPKISLIDHMRVHWETINFKPTNFKLDTSEDPENGPGDVPIKENERFTPPHKKSALPMVNENYTGVVIKNLPLEMTENDLKKFLVSKGLPEEASKMKIGKTERSTRVDIEDINGETCLNLIKNIHEKKFFDRVIYCRGLRDLITPVKTNTTEDNAAADNKSTELKASTQTGAIQRNTSSPTKASIIPGLSKDELAKAAKKARQKLKKNEKSMKSSKPENSIRETFLKTPVSPDPTTNYEFSDTEGSPSPSATSSKFFHHSPMLDHEKPNPMTALLSPGRFNSLSAKQIQKEELWRKQITPQPPMKRPSSSPAEDSERKTRSRSESSKILQGLSKLPLLTKQ